MSNLIVESFSDSDCCIFIFLPLKILVDENLVLPRLPVDIITNERTQCRTYCGEGVYCVGMGAGGLGVGTESHLIVAYNFFFP